jgi:hypothetical protein
MGKECALEPEVRHRIVERCITVTRDIVGMNFDTDTGYGSMGDDESDFGTVSEPEPESATEEVPIPAYEYDS